MIKDNTCAVILAAGFSSRMQTIKALLQTKEDDLFLEKIIKTYKKALINEIILVVNQELFEKLPKQIHKTQVGIIVNQNPEKGRLYSISLALKNIGSHKACFIHDVDRPCVKHETIVAMMKKNELNSYLQPRYKGQNGHPVLLCDSIIGFIRNSEIENQKLSDILMHFDKKTIEVNDFGVVVNINIPEDYKKYIES